MGALASLVRTYSGTGSFGHPSETIGEIIIMEGDDFFLPTHHQ